MRVCGWVALTAVAIPEMSPPPSYRDDHQIELGHLFDKFQADGALAGNHEGIIKGVNKDEVLGVLQFLTFGQEILAGSVQHHVSTIALGRFDLGSDRRC